MFATKSTHPVTVSKPTTIAMFSSFVRYKHNIVLCFPAVIRTIHC